MTLEIRKTGLVFFLSILFLTAVFQWSSVQAAYASLYVVRIFMPSSIGLGQEVVVQASVFASGCGSCVVSDVQVVLILPSQANLTFGDNPAYIGNMRGGQLKNVSWTVVFLEPGNYILEVNASGLDSDMFPCSVLGSAMIDVSANYSLLGDLNGDDIVNIMDVAIVTTSFGSSPGDPNWNSIADLDDNGFVNIIDIVLVALEYGKTL